uniref:Putative transcription elongation factor b polypeptide 3 n=1 Tax=Rhipicephalus microplus TaxID=6941 RepID=A0A6M2CWX1_RHIMP
MADCKEKILHYGKRLEKNQSDEKVLETLRKLQKVPMTLHLLQDTGIGRTVNHLKKNSGVVGELARAIISSWKQVVSDSTAEYPEPQQLPPVSSKRHHEGKQDGPPVKTSRTSKPYSIEVETSSPIENASTHSRHRQNGDTHQNNRHHHGHHHHHQNSSRHHHKEERAATPPPAPPPPKVDPPPKKSAEKNVDKKQMKKLLKKAGHSEGGLDGSIASFEACLGLNDTVPLPKPKKKPQAVSPSKKQHPSRVEPTKEATKQHSSKGAESSRSKNGESSGHSSSSRSSKHSNKKEQLMPEALRKPDLPPLDRDEVSSMLPEIQPVYKPLPHRSFIDDPPSKPLKKNLTNEEAIVFTSSRKDRTLVYSGRKCALSEIPTLYDMCLKVLIDNVEGMAYTGGVPYDILRPILEKCTPKQLYTLEDYNPYLLDDTDELWQVHCTREFKSSCPDAGETWRELYLKKFDEREEKFKSLTATITASMAKATPVRQTKLAYVDTVAKPPRNVARQQAKHGTGLQSAVPVRPSDRLSSRPASSPSASASISRPSAATPAIPKKPKVAPLMQKTLKFMKQRFKR